jgi:methionyl-tRNA formyltransferase
MQGTFSTPSLLALLEQGIEVCAVILPASPLPGQEGPVIRRKDAPTGRRASLPLLSASTNPSLVQLAWREHIPVWEIARLAHEETLALLSSYESDVLSVACFSQRIPRAVLTLPRLGCLNVHPSLLPANRGPVPLFWTFREGQERTGVTIHLLTEGMDTGDILAQETVDVPDGVSYEQLEIQCAQRGGVLLARSVWKLYEGKAIRRPQDEARSSYHTFPTDEDMVVRAEEWDARHVYNFIRGVGRWNGGVPVYERGRMFAVEDAISYSREIVEIDEYKMKDEQEIRVCCKDGYVVIEKRHLLL